MQFNFERFISWYYNYSNHWSWGNSLHSLKLKKLSWLRWNNKTMKLVHLWLVLHQAIPVITYYIQVFSLIILELQ
jgi:hypothetical protein